MVPGRSESAALLSSFDPPQWFVRHACAVAEIAAWLAARIALTGVAVDRRLVESAALLHDVDKLLPADDPVRRLPHGEGSAAFLARAGYDELGPPVAAHPVTRLLDGDDHGRRGLGGNGTGVARIDGDHAAPGLLEGDDSEVPLPVACRAVDQDTFGQSIESLIVAYADKRAGQRLEPMEARFASWRRRYPPTDSPSREPGGRAAGRRSTGGFDTAAIERMRARADRLEALVCTLAAVEPRQVRRMRWTRRAFAAATPRAPAPPTAAQRGARP